MVSLEVKEFEVLGTLYKIHLPQQFSFLFDSCFRELQRIEKKYTRFREDSYLMDLNSHLFTWQEVDEETLFLLQQAQELFNYSQKYFNISMKTKLDEIGYEGASSKKHFLSKFYKKPFCLKKNKVKFFKAIEIGGFGKGYSLDKLRELLNKSNVKSYILNAGGDIYIKGKHEIYLESPYNKDNVFAKLNLKDETLCSSSSSRRNFKKGSHLINPKKKDSDMLQVYIKHQDALICDALSTALFVMGFDKAKQFAVENNLLVFLVSLDNKVYDTLNVNYLK